MEVIYTGLRQSVEQVAEVALQEAVDVIGVSILSGSHVSIAKKLIKRIRERELDDVLVLFGGTIPKDDIAVLKEIGVQGVFPSHAKLDEISTFIKENVHHAGK
jgi:methylmalonyl-CoA mutase C-terminal domain/subunit